MINNNILFSLLISIISVTSFYFLSEKNEENLDKIYQNMLLLFGITFISVFILKSVSDVPKEIESVSENVLTHSTRAPF